MDLGTNSYSRGVTKLMLACFQIIIRVFVCEVSCLVLEWIALASGITSSTFQTCNVKGHYDV